MSAIGGYQQFISPHKGWHCAYAALHREASCSAYARDVIARDGAIRGGLLLFDRFRQCHEAAAAIRTASPEEACDKACKEVDTACDQACDECWEGFWKSLKESIERNKSAESPNHPPTQIGPPSGRPTPGEINESVRWAEERLRASQAGEEVWYPGQEPPDGYYNGCQAFVARAYKPDHSARPGDYQPYGTAALAMRDLELKGGEPPRGSWVFYTVSGDTRGHVGLSVGDGWVIHVNTWGGCAKVERHKYDPMPRCKYVGWAWPKLKVR